MGAHVRTMTSPLLLPMAARRLGGVARHTVFLAFALACAWTQAQEERVLIYAAPNGNDAWSGTLPEPNAERSDGPVTDLQLAVAMAREKRGDSTAGYEVCLRGGTYFLPRTLRLTQADSGTKDTPTVIRAYRNERPVLLGARPLEGWEPHRGPVLRVDLAANGLKGRRIRQLFAGGRRLTLARYPNVDPAKPLTSGWAYVDSEPPPAGVLEDVGAKRVLRMREEDVRSWAHPDRGEVFIFPGHEWWNNIVPIAAADHARRLVTLKRDCSYEIAPEDRYYVRGMLEELDAPGEWCTDAVGEVLYLWPSAPPDEAPVLAPVTRTILELKQARHVRVQGLTFQYCDGHAVTLRDCEQCLVAACTIRDVGDYHGSGVSVSGGRENGVVGCDISHTGHSGISLAGGDQKTRTPAGNYAENNHVTRTGVYYKQGSGISVRGVGNRVSRNTIHHVPRWAVGFGGNDHVIELNHLHHVSLETTDTGAVYGGSLNWLSGHGVVIRHNFIHDAIGRGRRNGEWRAPFYAWGIYLDWTAMGVTVSGNIVARAPRAGIMVHDGRFNTIENNIIFDCGTGEHEPGSQIEFSGWHIDHFFWKRGLGFGWVKQFESVADQPVWQRDGTTLRDPRQSALSDGRTMHSNVVRRNILCGHDPDAQTFRFRNVSFENNPSDHNLLWHDGSAIKTGLFRVREETGPNLVPNPGFEEGEADSVPPGWTPRLPWKGCSVARVTESPHGGAGALLMSGAASAALEGKPSWEREVAVQTPFIRTVVPGQHYRVSAWVKAGEPGTRVRLEALSYKGGAYDVRLSKPETTVGTEWQEIEGTFRLPQPGDGGYRQGMETTFYIRFILRQDEGTLWVDDVALHQATVMDEWEAWRAEGMDRHSVVADPLFVDPGNDDFRLREDSPAWTLGFRRIPVERIGCYADQWRTTWPLPSPASAMNDATE